MVKRVLSDAALSAVESLPASVMPDETGVVATSRARKAVTPKAAVNKQTHVIGSPVSPAAQSAIKLLARLIADRQAVIKTQRAIRQPVLARIYSYLGGAQAAMFGDENKGKRAEIWQQAEAVYEYAADVSKPFPAELAEVVTHAVPLVNAHQHATKPFDELRVSIEDQCRKLVTCMPTYTWWVTQRGCNDIGFAVIIGHSGDLNRWRTEGCLMKRFGLAVIDGMAQKNVPEGSDAKVWIDRGYNAVRRSAIHVVVDSIIKAQGKLHGGPWREVYTRRRTRCESIEKFGPPAKKKGHYHDDAMRYLATKVLRAWRQRWRLETGLALSVEASSK